MSITFPETAIGGADEPERRPSDDEPISYHLTDPALKTLGIEVPESDWDRIHAVIGQISTVGDWPESIPPAAPRRRWVRELFGSRKGEKLEVTCPAWCTDGHIDDHGHIDDLEHGHDVPGVTFPAPSGPMEVLMARLQVRPYADSHSWLKVPSIAMEVWEDEWVEDLGPDEFAVLISEVRALVGRWERLHAQLVEVRKQWTGPDA